MSESADGLMAPATRQVAGRAWVAGPLGGWSGPGGTERAETMVVPGSDSRARSSHFVPAEASGATSAASRANIIAKPPSRVDTRPKSADTQVTCLPKKRENGW